MFLNSLMEMTCGVADIIGTSAYTRFFFLGFSFCNLREYLLVIYLNSFWHKTHFNIHHIQFKRQL